MISTHILDTSLGQPAQGVSVQLLKKNGESWTQLASETTNTDGRISFQAAAEPGTYQLLFGVGDYFRSKKSDGFFESAPVIFNITNTGRKYHVPLLLSPFGYSTYRGS